VPAHLDRAEHGRRMAQPPERAVGQLADRFHGGRQPPRHRLFERGQGSEPGLLGPRAQVKAVNNRDWRADPRHAIAPLAPGAWHPRLKGDWIGPDPQHASEQAIIRLIYQRIERVGPATGRYRSRSSASRARAYRPETSLVYTLGLGVAPLPEHRLTSAPVPCEPIACKEPSCQRFLFAGYQG